ncbi:helix-turn-helix domain-containing protein [Rhodococcus globerulus]|uniref:XRE family transcriptional regulator n=1 Tax=Rhodococcus globerulus TaxID=33008 RepID=A0ABU4C2H3_RHOGO|nr:XRE family transcriptional regulator [Rhodococcus globerulus]MDV6270619.1 XRE family transcriptional regulator [Rhodococcus globerulus]
MTTPLHGIGQHLRQARLELGISLREMARRVDVSPSFISQVELGRTRPSVGTLYSIASELGMSLDDLMPQGSESQRTTDGDRTRGGIPQSRPEGPDPQGSPVQRAATRPELQIGGATWGRLTGGHDFANDFLHVTYAPGGQSCPENNLIHHPGHEYGYVLSGRLVVQIGFNSYELGPGDAINFESVTPHRLSNPFDTNSESVWLVVGRGGTPVL